MDVAVTIARAPAVLKKAIYPCRERMHQNNIIFLGQSPLGREPSQPHLWSCTCKWNNLKVLWTLYHGRSLCFGKEQTTGFKASEHHFIGVMSMFHQANECYIFTSFPSHHLLDHAGMNVFSAVSDFNLSQKSNFGNYIKTTRGATTICHFE